MTYLYSHITKPLLSPHELCQEFPLEYAEQQFIQESRKTIQNILSGADDRFLIVVGPCSVHDSRAAIEYALRLKSLAEKVSSHLFIVMRAYIEKPRSIVGWKGLLHDPHLDGSSDMNTGLRWSRQLLLNLAVNRVPCAVEFLEPMTSCYFSDLVSLGSIGARTSASQPHRQLASSLPMPVGFKNGVDGNLHIAIQGAVSSSYPHIFVNIDQNGKIVQMQSKGNPCPHIVLRGGGGKTNYDAHSVALALSLLKEAHVLPNLLIDCAHGNSGKNHYLQKDVFASVIDQVISGNANIRGIMLESHLFEGNQPHATIDELRYAVSLTDPCIGWESTEELIFHAFHMLHKPLAM